MPVVPVVPVVPVDCVPPSLPPIVQSVFPNSSIVQSKPGNCVDGIFQNNTTPKTKHATNASAARRRSEELGILLRSLRPKQLSIQRTIRSRVDCMKVYSCIHFPAKIGHISSRCSPRCARALSPCPTGRWPTLLLLWSYRDYRTRTTTFARDRAEVRECIAAHDPGDPSMFRVAA